MEKRIEYIEFDEVKKIYKAEKDKSTKLAILLGFGSGLRISEIIGLEKEISPCCKAEVITERRKLTGKTLKFKVCSNCKKDVKQSEIKRKKGEWLIPPLTKDKVDLVKHQIRIDLAKGGKWRVTVTPPALEESMLSLLPINIPRRTLQDRFCRLTKKTLGKRMSFHILRHGFGNYQVNVLHVPLPIVQQLMGHSRLDTTGIYTKANPEFAIQQSWKAMNGGK